MAGENFKAGQKVRCIQVDSFGGATVVPGDILTVTRRVGPTMFEADWQGRLDGLWYNCCFEVVPETIPEEPAEFVAGQKVRCIRTDSYNDVRVNPGDILTVGDPCHSQRMFRAAVEEEPCALWYKDRFEAIPDESTIQPGDYVHVVRGVCVDRYAAPVRVNMVEDARLLVEDPNGWEGPTSNPGKFWWVCRKDVEKAGAPETLETFKAAVAEAARAGLQKAAENGVELWPLDIIGPILARCGFSATIHQTPTVTLEPLTAK